MRRSFDESTALLDVLGEESLWQDELAVGPASGSGQLPTRREDSPETVGHRSHGAGL